MRFYNKVDKNLPRIKFLRHAAPELIIRSYKRLALKLHPDRNSKHDATEAFQLLARAYDTLKDESKRRAYDLIYPSITRSCPSSQTTQTPRPPPTSTPQSEALSEAAQIAALEKLKQERGARWRTKKNAFDSSIFELQRGIRRLEQEIKNLDSIVAAEAAEEARKNSWGTWLLSPIYKKAEDSEEEKARKDRGRQERKIEKDMKERRLGLKKADLKKEESMVKKAKEEVDTADLVEDGKICAIQNKIWARETRARVERERIARIWIQQQEQREKREQEAAEALRKQQAEERAAAQKRQEELAREWQKIIDDTSRARNRQEQYAHPNHCECFFTAEGSTHRAPTSTCRHDGWWEKVQGRTACPECHVIWTYLLQCPSCEMKACPKCQGELRRRIPRNNAARTSQRAPPRRWTPNRDFFNDDYYDY